MTDDDKPIANPFVLLREEFDDWAVLFDPDTGHGFGLNPAGVYLWKLLDGGHPIGTLLEELHTHAAGVPDEAGEHIGEFVDALVAEGLAGYDHAVFGLVVGLRNTADSTTLQPRKHSCAPPGAVSEGKPFTYESPKLVDLSRRAPAARGTCGDGSGDTGNCWSGGGPSQQCLTVGSAASYNRCCTGNGPGWTTNCLPGNCAHRDATCSAGGTLCQSGNSAGGEVCSTGT